MTLTESAWADYMEAVEARDIAVANAAARIEREFAGIVAQRMAAFMALSGRSTATKPPVLFCGKGGE